MDGATRDAARMSAPVSSMRPATRCRPSRSSSCGELTMFGNLSTTLSRRNCAVDVVTVSGTNFASFAAFTTWLQSPTPPAPGTIERLWRGLPLNRSAPATDRRRPGHLSTPVPCSLGRQLPEQRRCWAGLGTRKGRNPGTGKVLQTPSSSSETSHSDEAHHASPRPHRHRPSRHGRSGSSPSCRSSPRCFFGSYEISNLLLADMRLRGGADRRRSLGAHHQRRPRCNTHFTDTTNAVGLVMTPLPITGTPLPAQDRLC